VDAREHHQRARDLGLERTTIDAAFMARHGPRGLVAAARKIFGRFEAAMNLTALHLSKVSAENPPSGDPS
jgi:hypothetical protein